MEGAKGRNNKDFESMWADRFADAETPPADHIWKNISGELANQQVGSYKKRVFYYQWAAAASLFLALLLGVLYFMNTPTQRRGDLVSKNQTAKPNDQQNTLATSIDPEEQDSRQKGIEESNSASVSNLSAISEGDLREGEFVDQSTGDSPPSETLNSYVSHEVLNNLSSLSQPVELVDALQKEDQELNSLLSDQKQLQLKDEEVQLLSSQKLKYLNPDWILGLTELPDHIYSVPIYGNAESEQEDDVGQSLWAGLNLGSGSFDPNYGPPTGNLDESALAVEDAFAPALDANTAGLPLREENRSGPSVALGVDVGKSIGKRWVLQSGLTYGRYRVNSNTNLVFSTESQEVTPLSFQNRGALFSADQITVSSERVDIDNNFQLLSVPVKAGFIVLDRKFNILLNAGLASDIYLGNNLKSSDEALASYQIDPGADSPYRRVHINGLTSVQLGYQIQKNYYLSLEPTYRRALSNFAKVGTNFSSRPSSLGLVVGFRYLFK